MEDGELFPFRENDYQVIDYYRDFLPKRIFDAHMHLYLAETIPNALSTEDCVFRKGSISVSDYRRDMKKVFPGVQSMEMNMIPMPDPVMNDLKNGLRDKANEHVLKEYQRHPECAASVYVLPCDSEKTIYGLAERPGARALKCYCYGADTRDYESLSIGGFLPEAAWTVANEKKLPIILHIMRPNALSDEQNISYIEKMTRRYPDAQLVLAHCGRAFAAWTCVKQIQRLEDRGNVWFDMAAICEPGPMMACIIKNAGKRTMWGSDYPICMHRGRAISVGGGQNWLLGERFNCLERTFVAVENLLAFYQAALLLDLDQTQIEDLFFNNASELFGGNQQN